MSLTNSSPKRLRAGDTKTPVKLCVRDCGTLEREEQQYEAKLAALRAAIDEGDASGVAKGDVFARVRKIRKLPPRRR
jgi:hypothetical protein